ncbi:MAG: hypothetical protein K5694_00180 [Bacilli bacterium]|nr:hypothetical protein [Bacilli bacterium]
MRYVSMLLNLYLDIISFAPLEGRNIFKDEEYGAFVDYLVDEHFFFIDEENATSDSPRLAGCALIKYLFADDNEEISRESLLKNIREYLPSEANPTEEVEELVSLAFALSKSKYHGDNEDLLPLLLKGAKDYKDYFYDTFKGVLPYSLYLDIIQKADPKDHQQLEFALISYALYHSERIDEVAKFSDPHEKLESEYAKLALMYYFYFRGDLEKAKQYMDSLEEYDLFDDTEVKAFEREIEEGKVGRYAASPKIRNLTLARDILEKDDNSLLSVTEAFELIYRAAVKGSEEAVDEMSYFFFNVMEDADDIFKFGNPLLDFEHEIDHSKVFEGILPLKFSFDKAKADDERIFDKYKDFLFKAGIYGKVLNYFYPSYGERDLFGSKIPPLFHFSKDEGNREGSYVLLFDGTKISLANLFTNLFFKEKDSSPLISYGEETDIDEDMGLLGSSTYTFLSWAPMLDSPSFHHRSLFKVGDFSAYVRKRKDRDKWNVLPLSVHQVISHSRSTGFLSFSGRHDNLYCLRNEPLIAQGEKVYTIRPVKFSYLESYSYAKHFLSSIVDSYESDEENASFYRSIKLSNLFLLKEDELTKPNIKLAIFGPSLKGYVKGAYPKPILDFLAPVIAHRRELKGENLAYSHMAYELYFEYYTLDLAKTGAYFESARELMMKMNDEESKKEFYKATIRRYNENHHEFYHYAYCLHYGIGTEPSSEAATKLLHNVMAEYPEFVVSLKEQFKKNEKIEAMSIEEFKLCYLNDSEGFFSLFYVDPTEKD